MTRRKTVAVIFLVLSGGLVRATEPGAGDKHPVYVGARVCISCHATPQSECGLMYWALSKHAGAFASLWSPDSKEIARLSGIAEEPQNARACLGCHATAYDSEPWERLDTFFIEDGIQCERCHGPGSEYIAPEIMTDSDLAVQNGLRFPVERQCMHCHREKGSHVAVLKTHPIDVKAVLAGSALPGAGDTVTRFTEREEPALETPVPGEDPQDRDGFHYTGVMACATCHRGPEMGYQFSRWRESPHARAYAVLGTPLARRMSEKEGVSGNPQQSPLCLRCHATGAEASADGFMSGFAQSDGVQCESCHGPGSAYAPEAVMRDPRAARQAGLQPVMRQTCRRCHENAHGRAFDYATGWQKIAHPTRMGKQASGPIYKTPLHMAITPDGRELYVTCEASRSVIVIDVRSRGKVAEIEVGGQPTEVDFSPDGGRAFVSNRQDDSLAVIDVPRRSVIRIVPIGDEPHGVLADPTGRFLYTLNSGTSSISVMDLESLDEVRRLVAGRMPWALAGSPDGRWIAVTSALPQFVPFREASSSEVTLIDMEGAVIAKRVQVPGANLLMGIDWHPNSEFALCVLNRTKNMVPMTRLIQGWTITNGLGVIRPDGTADQVLLDEPDRCFPDPTDVAISPDGRHALVTSSGSDRVAVVDVDSLLKIIASASSAERRDVLPNHLGMPTKFISKHIPTGRSPRGVLFTPDGTTAFVANSLDDSLTVIDARKWEAVDRIDLGGPKEITQARYGERLFHSADIAFRRQFSCHSCHPDGHVNGLTFDIEPDGIGFAPVDNRTLRGILDTAPFKWEGTNPSLQRQCGPRLAVFFTRIDPFTPEELVALERYICTIPIPPNRYRAPDGKLTPAQRRGKIIFERARTNTGDVIPLDNRCDTCHFPPLYTDGTRRDIGSKMWLDRESRFDVCHLMNIYDSAPYMHNGIAETLEEIWTRYNPYDTHGVTNDLTKDQLNDLIEYLKTI